MENQRPTFYEEVREKGVSRRDFLKFCASMAALLGLEASGVGQIVKALESRNAPVAVNPLSAPHILLLLTSY